MPKHANTKIAIIDTGVMKNHDDLKNNFSTDSKNLVPLNGFRGTEPEEQVMFTMSMIGKDMARWCRVKRVLMVS
ncbi:hypothetical protein ACVNP1_08190 [Staphylococcus aureus]